MDRPFVSVVLPVRNEARHLRPCLEAVLAQDYPADDMEILVADGMSDDGTRAIVAEFARRDPRVRLVDNPGRIVPAGLNAAIARARGSVVVRVDGHTLVERDYVARAVEALARTGADVVGGSMTPRARSLFGRAVALATSTPMGVGGSRFHYALSEEPAESVYMGSFRRDAFTRFGLFDEGLVRNQDDEFNYRVREAGGQVVLAPAMRSWYTPRETPGALFRQYLQYGYYKVRVAALHPRMARPRHLIPSAFVLVSAGLAAASPVVPAAGGLLAAGWALHAAASLALALPGGRRDPAAWALVPAATLLLHVGYGTGFLAGAAAAAAGRAPGGGRRAAEGRASGAGTEAP
jgi:glycosyltransferase involved in cell wall biosynthesis